MAVSPEHAGEESEEEEEERAAEGTEGTEGERIKAEKEGERLKKIADPRRPTEREVGDRNRAHLRFRNWHPCRAQAKGRDLDHRTAVGEKRGLSEHSSDFCFSGDELGYNLIVMVGRERTTLGRRWPQWRPRRGRPASSRHAR